MAELRLPCSGDGRVQPLLELPQCLAVRGDLRPCHLRAQPDQLFQALFERIFDAWVVAWLMPSDTVLIAALICARTSCGVGMVPRMVLVWRA